MYFVYIIKCSGNKLYTGITNDVKRRMNEHFEKTERCAKFTRSHKAESLEAVWRTENRSLALKLEWKIKQLTRSQKDSLINDESKFEKLINNEDKLFYEREKIENF